MHTKGPWKLFEGEHSEVVEVLDNRGLPIVSWGGFDDSRRTDEEHNANARLIAEAPAMLEFINEIADTRKWHEGTIEYFIEEAQKIARKAKGD